MKYLIFLFFSISCICYTSSLIPIVYTKYGYIRGVQTDKTLQYLGIPYASPPVGALRWVPPHSPLPWKPDVYNATIVMPGCPQKYCTEYLPNTSCPVETSEDCLYLNIWTPLNAANTSGYPVLVFIHGGSFRWGSGGMTVYDGNNLASEGHVIVVTIEYRLGLLGFLYTGDGPFDAHGNYGIRDQRKALQWVQANIAQFGGDPEKITIFGQSAGSQSVFIHMMSSKTAGLFRAAVLESAPFAVPYRTKKEALELTDKVLKLLNCNRKTTIECLRNKTVDEINDVEDEITLKLTGRKLNEYYEPIGPIIDGNELTIQPMIAAATGKYRKMPIIIGTVSEEGRSFVYGAWKKNLTLDEYRAALGIVHPQHFEEIEKFYAPKPELYDYRDDLSQVITDYLFICAVKNSTRHFVNITSDKVFLYLFEHATVVKGGWGKDSFCEGHVCHSEELRYVFNNQIVNTTADENTLSETMVSYWSNFAYTNDPNIGPLPVSLRWPTFHYNDSTTMHFKTPINELISDYRNDYCTFWNNIGF